MARKLKSYVTSIGFFELAVAAPSMKAALEAWGLDRNVFQQGFAQETDDPAIVAATTAKPGVVLRRPVGSKAGFKEDASIPGDMTLAAKARRPEPARKKQKPKPSRNKTSQAQIISFEKEKAKRERERAREDSVREKRERAVDKLQGEIARARQKHDAELEKIEARRRTIARQESLENQRWDRQRKKLDAAMDRARQP